jgi:holo-[acyl-carrier protein] synthase
MEKLRNGLYRVSIGIDIVDIERIERILKEKPGFINRYFSSDEISLIKDKKNLARHVAGRFAGKEAAVKAMGTGISGFSLKEVEILNDKNGRPYVKLNGKAKEAAEKLNVKEFAVSISYSGKTAVASAVALTLDEEPAGIE